MSDQGFIESVNSQLDAEAFIRKIDFRADKMVRIGEAIKTPCPVHRDERFATLLVFPSKNTCKCLKAGCEAHEEQTLVELYGKVVGKTGVSAALAAADLAGIEVPAQFRAQMLEDRIEAARDGLTPETAVEAQSILAEADAAGIENVSTQLLGAAIAKLEGNTEGAAMQAAFAAETLRQTGRLEQAEAALRDHADPVTSNNDIVITEWIEVLLARSRDEEACELLLRRCERLEKEDAAAANAELLDSFGDLVSRDPRLRLHFGRALEAEGDPAKAKAQFQRAASMSGAATETRIAALEAFVRLEPDAVDLREELAHLLMETGRASEATSQLGTLGGQALRAGAKAQARRCYERILEHDPESITGREGLAECLHLEGNVAGEAEQRLHIARIYRDLSFEDQAEEQFDASLECLAKGIASVPNDVELILLRRRAFVDSGRATTPEAPGEDIHALLDSAGALDSMMTLLRKQLEINPADPTAALLLGELFEVSDEKLNAIEVLARCIEEQDGAEPELLNPIADALLRLDPDHSAGLAARGRLAAAEGDIEGALAALRTAATAAADSQRHQAAAKLWGDVLALEGDDIDALRARIDCLARAGLGEELSGAIALLHESAATDDDEVLAWLAGLAETLTDTTSENAVTLCDRALESWPRNLKLMEARHAAATMDGGVPSLDESLGYAEVLLDANRASDAEEVLRPHLDQAPTNDVVVSAMVRALKADGRNSEAAHLLLEPARERTKKGDAKRAVELYEEALLLDEKSLAAHAELGELHEQAGRKAEASANFLAAARLVVEKGEREEAKPLYDKAFALSPDAAEIAGEYLDYLVDIGARDAACQRALDLATRAFQGGNTERGTEFAQRSIKAFPLSLPNRLLAVRLLMEKAPPVGVIEAIAAASAFLEKPDPEAARQFIDSAMEADSENQELQRLGVRVALAQDKPNEAATILQRIAIVAVEGEDWPAAETAWRDLLEIAPNHIQAREGIATALEKQGGERALEAVEILLDLADRHEGEAKAEERVAFQQRALTLDSSLTDVRRDLARTLLDMGRFEEARTHFFELAESARKSGDHALAVDYFEKLLESDPENPDILQKQVELTRESGDTEKFTAYALRLAAVHNKNHRVSDAIAVCRTIVEADPESLDARVLLSSYLASEGNTNEAAATLFEVAERYAELGDTHNARDVLSRAERFDIDDAGLQRRFGELYLLTGAETEGLNHLHIALRMYQAEQSWSEALAIIETLLEHLGRDRDLLHKRCKIFEESGDIKSAAEGLLELAELQRTQPTQRIATLEQLLQLNPLHREARLMLIRSRRDLGDHGQALEELLSLARESLPEQPEEASPLLEEALEMEEEFVTELHESLHEVYGATGREKEAMEQAVLLVGHLTAKGELEKARRILDTAREESGDALPLRKVSARLALREGRREEAAAELLLIAEACEKAGELGEQIDTLSSALEAAPENPEILSALSEALGKIKEPDETIQQTTVVLRRLLEAGEIEAAHNFADHTCTFDAIREKLHRVASELFIEFRIPELAAEHLATLARIRFEQDDLETARKLNDEAISLRPRHVAARLLRAEMLEKSGEKDAAFDTLREVTNTLLDASACEEAVVVLRRMLAIRPDDAERREMLAVQLDRIGKLDELAEELERLAMLYQEANQTEDAIRTRKRLVDLRPEDPKARLSLIEMYAQARAGIDLMPALVDLADLYVRLGLFDEAVDALEKAVAAAPEEHALRERLIKMLLEQKRDRDALHHTQALVEGLAHRKRFRQAAAALDRVREVGERNADFHLAEAQVHAAQKQRGKAMEGLTRALELYRKEDEKVRMTETLREILALDPHNAERHQELIGLLVEIDRMDEALDERAALANVHIEREFYDLAEEELRKILEVDPSREDVWHKLFATRAQIGAHEEAVEDYMRFADLLREKNRIPDALDILSEAIRADPHSIDARESYIETFLLAGDESDLCEEYLALADLYIANNRVDEGVELFGKVMSLDPDNRDARERLSETQAKRRAGMPLPVRKGDPPPFRRPHDSWSPGDSSKQSPPYQEPEPEAAETQSKRTAAAAYAARNAEKKTAESQDGEQDELRQVQQSYRDILSVNPQNAEVRIKLADICQQLNENDEMVDQLRLASESLFQKGDLATCITVCERILKIRPADQKVRLRLKQAFNKRDAFKALESAILFSDQVEDNPRGGSSGPRS